MLLAMLTFFTKPENLDNAAMKMRSGGKAGYTYAIKNRRQNKKYSAFIKRILFNKQQLLNKCFVFGS